MSEVETRSNCKVQVSGFRFQVSGFRFQVSGFRFQVSGFRFQVSGFRFQVSGFRFIPERNSFANFAHPDKQALRPLQLNPYLH
ncbi:hypothetical protein [Flavobacterium sp. ENC]|uniref:hypothetical protein n=1 Tax=Flavobacterium sp. ENC TaxID=2897330 RepID=UPI001E2EAF98|nr:hypothetical protein [Flavobacterium sp. ENC]MCD0464892.1 hypothetical protein [Flavobacterium sp. ENC]